ncbi:MAG: DNA alkylation repair protein [Ilumatobacteraceae bacterium]
MPIRSTAPRSGPNSTASSHRDLELDEFIEREFFIRKVLGWVAREIGSRDPAPVSTWLQANLGQMNGVTIGEAVKYLPDGGEIITAWTAR